MEACVGWFANVADIAGVCDDNAPNEQDDASADGGPRNELDEPCICCIDV